MKVANEFHVDLSGEEDCLPCICISCHYPCAYYQMYVSLKEWRRDSKSQVPAADVVEDNEPQNNSPGMLQPDTKAATPYRVMLPGNAVPGSLIEVYLPSLDRLVEVQVPHNQPAGHNYLDIVVPP